MTIRVLDMDVGAIKNGRYDLCVFASGYEERCTHAPRLLEDAGCARSLVLGFSQVRGAEQRSVNDEYFNKTWKKVPVLMGADDDGPIYKHLRRLVPEGTDSIRMAVDYSSMSRLWYAAVLTWAQYMPGLHRVEIDFIYSLGCYEENLSPLVIDEILCIPGCEGSALRSRESIAVFGLGFHGLMAQCVLDKLEPDRVYAYLASPGVVPEYLERVRRNNQVIIDHADAVLELPLASVDTTMTYLTDLVLPHRTQSEIVLVPMGPKPHALAAILLAMRFPEVSCLRVSTQRQRPSRVEAAGGCVVTRVAIENQLSEQ